MKKVLFLGAFALFGLASCKKDYTCECKITFMGQTTTSTTTINAKKKDAQTTCENGTNAATGVTCALK